MAPLTDYQEQTRSRNIIRNILINATRRVICYNQHIYNDERLELSEYAGLQLDVREATFDLVLVQELYDNAAILILDDDSQLIQNVYMHVNIRKLMATTTDITYIYSANCATGI